MTLRVVVADDQAAVREGLVLLLGLLDGVEVVGAAVDGEQAVALAGELRPDVVVMDLRMPRLDGVEATRRLAGGPPVLVLTTYADDDWLLPALRAGARGYLTKDADAARIEAALRTVAAGETYLEPAVQARLVQLVATAPPTPDVDVGLTEREREVLGAIARGLANREIARELFVSEATVKTHVNNLFAKLGVSGRAAAVAYAFAHGLAMPRATPTQP